MTDAAVTSFNQASTILTKAAAKLDTNLTGFSAFLKEYSDKTTENDKALFGRYENLLKKYLNKDTSKKDPEKTIFNTMEAKLTGIFSKMFTKDKAEDEKKPELETLQSISDNLKKPEQADFVTAEEQNRKQLVVLAGVSDEAINKLKELLPAVAKPEADKNTQSGMGKAGNIMALGGAIVVVTGMALALAQFADVPWMNILKVVTVMGIMGTAIWAFTKIPSETLLKTSAALLVFGVAMLATAVSLQMIAGLDWAGVLKGAIVLDGLTFALLMLADVAPLVLEASIALGLVGLALMATVYSLNMLSGVDWVAVGLFSVFLAALGYGLTLMLPVIVPAAGALILLGGAFALFSVGLLAIAAGIKIVSTALPAFSAFFKELMDINPLKIYALIPALFGFSAAMLPVVMLAPLMAFAAIGLTALSAGMGLLAVGAGALSLSLPTLTDFVKTLDSFNMSKLIALSPALIGLAGSLGILSIAMTAFAVGNLVSGALNSIAGFFGGLLPEKETEKIFKTVDALKELHQKASAIDSTAIDNIGESLRKVAGIDASAIIASGKGMGAVVSSINRIDTAVIKTLAEADLGGFATNFERIATIGEVSFGKTQGELEKIVDTVNNLSLLKVGALASIISAGKPVEFVFGEKEGNKNTETPEVKATRDIAMAVNKLQNTSEGGTHQIVDVLERLISAVKENKPIEAPVVQTNTVIQSGNGGGGSAPSVSPSGIPVRVAAKSTIGLNSRG